MADGTVTQIRGNKQIVKGDQLWLFISNSISGDTAAAAAPIAFATSCSLNRSLSTNSISSKDHGTTSYVTPGDGSWTASTEALYALASTPSGEPALSAATTFANLMSIFETGKLIKVKFGYVSGGGTNIVDADTQQTEWTISSGWEGEGYLTSLQASGSHGDAATFSAEITGIGPLTAIA